MVDYNMLPFLVIDGEKSKTRNLAGLTFGHLLVLNFAGRGGSVNKVRWNTRCICGKLGSSTGENLRSGAVKSCGCKVIRKGHKMSRTRPYNIWCGIVRRVEDSDNQYYAHRGIRMCERWRNSFESFWEDMSPSYNNAFSIDRIDNNGNYSCGKCQDCVENKMTFNCRWVTHKVQMNNTRGNNIVEWDGERMTLTQLCEKLNLNFSRTLARLTLGWSLCDAITQPLNTRHSSICK